MNQVIWGNSVQMWLWALVVNVLIYTILAIIRKRFLGWFASRIEISEAETVTIPLIANHLIQHISRLLLLTFAIFVASQILQLPRPVADILTIIIRISLFYQMGLLGHAAINLFLRHTPSKLQENTPDTIMLGFSLLGKIVLWSVVVLLSLENVGVNITTLIASLGIGDRS